MRINLSRNDDTRDPEGTLAMRPNTPGKAPPTHGRLLSALIVACMIVSVAFVHGISAASTGSRSLETRLQALEDEKEIRELLVEYGHRFDTFDFVGYSKLFSEKGTWKGNYGGQYVVATGPSEVLAMMNRVNGSTKYDPKNIAAMHLMTNFFIQVNGDRAVSRSRWTFFTRDEHNKLVASLAGHYEDILIREKGQWKFLERKVTRDIPPED
jgi:hypothetical protein